MSSRSWNILRYFRCSFLSHPRWWPIKKSRYEAVTLGRQHLTTWSNIQQPTPNTNKPAVTNRYSWTVGSLIWFQERMCICDIWTFQRLFFWSEISSRVDFCWHLQLFGWFCCLFVSRWWFQWCFLKLDLKHVSLFDGFFLCCLRLNMFFSVSKLLPFVYSVFLFKGCLLRWKDMFIWGSHFPDRRWKHWLALFIFSKWMCSWCDSWILRLTLCFMMIMPKKAVNENV